MGAAHRSTHGRAQAIEDRFETLRTRRLALSAETVGPRNLARSLARFDPHAYSTSAVTLLGAHCATARERAGMWLMRLLQLDKDERVVDQGATSLPATKCSSTGKFGNAAMPNPASATAASA